MSFVACIFVHLISIRKAVPWRRLWHSNGRSISDLTRRNLHGRKKCLSSGPTCEGPPLEDGSDSAGGGWHAGDFVQWLQVIGFDSRFIFIGAWPVVTAYQPGAAACVVPIRVGVHISGAWTGRLVHGAMGIGRRLGMPALTRRLRSWWERFRAWPTWWRILRLLDQ